MLSSVHRGDLYLVVDASAPARNRTGLSSESNVLSFPLALRFERKSLNALRICSDPEGGASTASWGGEERLVSGIERVEVSQRRSGGVHSGRVMMYHAYLQLAFHVLRLILHASFRHGTEKARASAACSGDDRQGGTRFCIKLAPARSQQPK